jgi:hypothetical protein
MTDKNTTDLPAGKPPDVPPEHVEATPSVATDAEGTKSPDLPQKPVGATPSVTTDVKGSRVPLTKVTPTASIDAGKYKELRIEPRLHVRWHADAHIDGQGVYQGIVKDISSKGTDIFLDCNLQKVKLVRLRIYVPPASKTCGPHVMEVSGKIIYTAYDSKESLFHTGVNFLRFNLESDLAYLQSRIAVFNRAR